ncbi:MAG: YhcH/YjgK/YiaL family protein [Oscillospiraceae bacterium]|nr:YhcH/YjgK/YiaL family protein [Oscillospiraceae bacterium]
MIFDQIEIFKNYKGLGRVYDGLKLLAETDFSKVEPGRYEVDGANLFYNVQEFETRAEQKNSEAHKKYIDIQFVYGGEELIGWAPITTAEKKLVTENEAGDAWIYEVETENLILKDRRFAVFYPEDLHRPCMAVKEPAMCKKVVVKVKID